MCSWIMIISIWCEWECDWERAWIESNRNAMQLKWISSSSSLRLVRYFGQANGIHNSKHYVHDIIKFQHESIVFGVQSFIYWSHSTDWYLSTIHICVSNWIDVARHFFQFESQMCYDDTCTPIYQQNKWTKDYWHLNYIT